MSFLTKILLGKKEVFLELQISESWENADIIHIIETLTTGTALQFVGSQKYLIVEKNESVLWIISTNCSFSHSYLQVNSYVIIFLQLKLTKVNFTAFEWMKNSNVLSSRNSKYSIETFDSLSFLVNCYQNKFNYCCKNRKTWCRFWSTFRQIICIAMVVYTSI